MVRLGYARVSDASQSHDLQMDALRQAGCQHIYVETASGARADRPELRKLLDAVQPGSQVVCWRLDRMARSLRHLIEIAETLRQREVGLVSVTEGIDTTTPAGRFLFHVLGSLAEMEREIIVERTKAGLRAAAARGRRGGRPPSMNEAQVRAAKAMLRSGEMTAAEVAAQLGVSPSTLYRHLPGGRGSLEQAA
jgi:DNA invertase Pin-like site-specific DNA recombinase